MSESHLNRQKPIAIIIICFIGIINASQLIFMVLSPVSKQLGAFYPYYFAISAIMSLASIAGLWGLKKWAALLYIAVLISNQLVLASMKLWKVSSIIMPLIIKILFLSFFFKLLPCHLFDGYFSFLF